MNNLRTLLTLAAGLTLTVGTSSAATPSPSATPGREAELIAVLKSDAAQKEKADACRELARVGTKDAVPVLASLLGDEKLSHMARYGLETIPGSAVDQALRDALGTLKGRELTGVITSLGVRRDAKAVAPVGRFLRDTDPEVAIAAARSLGSIGTTSAVKALEAALAGAPAAHKLAVCEGLFRCAERFSVQGQRRDALRIYDQLRGLPDAAHQVRAGALRGAILARQQDGVPLLAEAIRGTDWVLADAAARTAMELPGAAVTKALTGALDQVSGDRKVLVLQVLGKRADAAALPAVLQVARSGDKPVRIAAIRAVAEIGEASVATSLVELTCAADREISEAARESLASLPGKKADDAVLAMLSNPDLNQKLAGIDQIARRRMSTAVPVLEKAADAADPKLRAAALKQLGEFGGEPELPTLLARLSRATDAQDLSALEEALSTLCARIGKPDVCADQLIARLPSATPAQKAALFSVLGSVGGGKALSAVRAAVGDANKQIHTAAVNALNAWPTPDAAPELLALARTAGDADEKTECLRSYLRWAADAEVPAKQRLTMCQEAAGLIQRDQEKKLLLAALGGVNSPEAVAQILPFVEEPVTREEACVAIVNIAERMSRGRNAAKLVPRVIAAMEKVGQATSNAEVAKRAKAILDANK